MITDEGSVFPIVVFDGAENWNTLLKLAGPNLDVRGLQRLRSVLEGKCNCVIIERHYIDKDYRDTFSHFHSKRFSTPSSRCIRLHFFEEPVTQSAIAEGEKVVLNSYLGYSIIRPTKPNCIGRTLLAHRLRLNPQAHISLCPESINLLGARVDIQGFPFISQDGDATVCAQSALWMLLRYYSNRYSLYSEIHPFEITNLASSHAIGHRIYPSPGLHSWQLAEALRLQGFSPVVYSRKQFPKNFDHLLYTYIESGLPLLVTVPRHVIVGYGHVSDYTAPEPVPWHDFLYTSYFNRALVVSDDNQFPYQMLNQNGPSAPTDSRYRWDDIEEFIVPLPEKVFLAAEQAQTAIEIVLRSPTVGITSLSPILQEKKLILRLFLTSARSFKCLLHKRAMGSDSVERIYRTLPMPHFMWICEIADFDEYKAARKVLGELIWDATRNAEEPDGWIACHFPESLALDTGSAFNKPQKFKTFPLKTHNSYSIFDSNLHSL
jgi:hypothetical protein